MAQIYKLINYSINKIKKRQIKEIKKVQLIKINNFQN